MQQQHKSSSNNRSETDGSPNRKPAGVYDRTASQSPGPRTPPRHSGENHRSNRFLPSFSPSNTTTTTRNAPSASPYSSSNTNNQLPPRNPSHDRVNRTSNHGSPSPGPSHRSHSTSSTGDRSQQQQTQHHRSHSGDRDPSQNSRSNSTGPTTNRSQPEGKACPSCHTYYTHYRWHGPHIFGYTNGTSYLHVCPTCGKQVCYVCNGPWPCTKGCPFFCRSGSNGCSPYFTCSMCQICANEDHCTVCDSNCGTVNLSEDDTLIPNLPPLPTVYKTADMIDKEKSSRKNVNPGSIYQQIVRFLSDESIGYYPKLIADMYADPTAEGWINLAVLGSEYKLQLLLIPKGSEYTVDMDDKHSTLVTRIAPNIINMEDKVPIMVYAIEKYDQGTFTLSADKRRIRRNVPFQVLKNHPKYQLNGNKIYKLSYKGILETDSYASFTPSNRKDSINSSDSDTVTENNDEPDRTLIYSSTAYNYLVLKEIGNSVSYIFSDKNLSRSPIMNKMLVQDTSNEGWIRITDILGNPRLDEAIKNFKTTTNLDLPTRAETDTETSDQPTISNDLALCVLAIQKYLSKDLALSKNLLRVKRRSPWIISAEVQAQFAKAIRTDAAIFQKQKKDSLTTISVGDIPGDESTESKKALKEGNDQETQDEQDVETIQITDDGKYISPILPTTRLSQLRTLVESCFNPSHINYTYTSALLRAHAERDPGAWISLQTICWLPLLSKTRVVISELVKALVNSRYVQISRDGLWIRSRFVGKGSGLSILAPISPSLLRRTNSHEDLPHDIADAVNYMLSPHHLATHRELLQLLFHIPLRSPTENENTIIDKYQLKQPKWIDIVRLLRNYVVMYPFSVPSSFQRIRDIDEATLIYYLPKVLQRVRRVHRNLGSLPNDLVNEETTERNLTKEDRSPLYSPVTPYSFQQGSDKFPSSFSSSSSSFSEINVPTVDLYLHRLRYRNGEQYLAGNLESLPNVNDKNFSVMNYNILGPHTTRNQYLYANDASLTWEHRRTRIVSEIQYLLPDVITLQELSSLHNSPLGWDDPSIDPETDCSVWIRQCMNKLGYDGIYMRSELDKMSEYLIHLREACYKCKVDLPLPLLRPTFPRPSSDMDRQPDIKIMETLLPLPHLVIVTDDDLNPTGNGEVQSTIESNVTANISLELPESSTGGASATAAPKPTLETPKSPSLLPHRYAATEVLGVALFWKKGTFTPIKAQRVCYSGLFLEALGHLTDRQSVETYFLLARRAKVGCFAALQHNTTGKRLVIGSGHISCCFEYPPVQMIEAQAFALTAGRLATDIAAGEAHLVPVILGADWNSKPRERLYTLVTEGTVPLEQWKVEAPKMGRQKRNFLITDNGFYTLPFGLSLPSFPYLRSAYENILGAEPLYTNYVYRAEPERTLIGTEKNNTTVPKGLEPPGATVRYFQGFQESITGNTLIRHVQFRECLDFIFYTDYLLQAVAVLEVPSEEEVTKEGALPNTRFPSDHVPIMTIFDWKSTTNTSLNDHRNLLPTRV